MPLTQDQEGREHELRLDQMTVNIEKLRSDIRYEGRKFFVQALVGVAVSVGAGVALATYVNSHYRPEPSPQPQIIYLQPSPPPALATPGTKP